MEASGSASRELSEKFIKNAESFEKEVKAKLLWTKEQWIEAGQVNSKMHRLSNSLNYWKRKLKPAIRQNSVILTLFNEHKDARMFLLDLVVAVEQLDSLVHVSGYSEFRNPRYMCLYFTTEQGRQIAFDNFKMVNDSHVVFMDWALGTETDTLKVHWLPMALDIEVIKAEVEKYADIVEYTRKSLLLINGRSLPSGKITFKVKFKKDVRPADVPHLADIGDMEALLTIRGRLPLCLNCGILGHISKVCKLRYCGSCRMQMKKDHSCLESGDNASYACVLKKGEKPQLDPDDWGPLGELESRDLFIAKQTKINKLDLEEKILNLERQINKVDVPSGEVPLRTERKRKAVDNTAVDNQDWGEQGESSSSSVLGSDVEVEKDEDMQTGTPVDVVGSGFGESAFTASSLAPRPTNKKTYGKFGLSAKALAKAQKDFDKLTEQSGFVFGD